MAKLEDITVGATILGLAGNVPVHVLATKWYGNTALEVTFKDAQGQPANQLLYREDEQRLSVVDKRLP
jgi:helicase domain protein